MTLTSGGAILLSDGSGGQYTNSEIVTGMAPDAVLDIVDNTISGYGQLGAGVLTLINEASGGITGTGGVLTVDTGANTVTNKGLAQAVGGSLVFASAVTNSGSIAAGAAGGVVFGGKAVNTGHVSAAAAGTVTAHGRMTDTAAAMTIGTGGILIPDGGTIAGGTILAAAGSGMEVTANGGGLSALALSNARTMHITGNAPFGLRSTLTLGGTVALSGAGQVVLADASGGAYNASEAITGTSSAALLDNIDNTIGGYGLLGAGTLALSNEAKGSIIALAGQLTVDTGQNLIANRGLLAAAAGGTQRVSSGVTNTGSIIARTAGSVVLGGAVTNGGLIGAEADGTVTAQNLVSGAGNLVTVAGKGTLVLDGGTLAAGKLTNAAGGVVSVTANGGGLSGIAVANAGTIGVTGNAPFGLRSTLTLDGTVALSGAGLVVLGDASGGAFNTSEAITDTSSAALLDNIGNTIAGYGLLGAGRLAITNETKGTIAAVGGVLRLDTGAKTVINSGLIEALGGTLVIRSLVDNIGGGAISILIDNNMHGLVLLDGGTLLGGSIATDQTDLASVLSLTTAGGALDGSKGAVTIGKGAQVVDNQGSALTLAGAVVNSGTVAVAGNAPFGIRSSLAVRGAVTLTGGGAILLSDGSGVGFTNSEIVTGTAPDAVLDNVDNTISGYGQLGAGVLTLTNAALGGITGTGGVLTVDTGANTVVNRGVLQARNGVLDLRSAVDNRQGNIAANDGTVLLDGITVSGGTLSSTAAGTIAIAAGVTLDGGTETVLIAAGARVAGAAVTVRGTVTNTGIVDAAVDVAGASVFTNFGGISGALTLGGGDSLITGAGAVFGGGILGGGGNTLEIAFGPYALLNFNAPGSAGFSVLKIDAGATVTTDASDILTGVSLINHCALNLTAFATGVPVLNDGDITGDVTLTAGVSLINSAGGTISGAGVAVIEGLNGPISVVNTGLIDPASNGVLLHAGGTVTNNAGGVIEGSVTGVNIAGGAGTVTNAGTIAGGGGTAVSFASGFPNRVAVLPGAVFQGKVDGGNTNAGSAISTLELGMASNQGTIEGFGTQFLNFAQVTAGPFASWAVAGTNNLVSGGTLIDQGSLLVSASTLAIPGLVTVGQAGHGHLLVQSQGTLQSGDPAVASATQGLDTGAAAGGSGDISVVDAGSTLSNTGRFVIGDTGAGSLTILSGGSVVTSPGAAAGLAGAVIGDKASASGSNVNVNGAGSNLRITGSLIVGNAGFGSLSLSQGGTVKAGSLDLGAAAGGDGVVSVSGVGSVLNLTGDLVVSDKSAGELAVFGGGLVSAQNLLIGLTKDVSGSVNIQDAGSHLNIGNAITIGVNGPGILSIGVGATLTAPHGLVIGPLGHLNNQGGVVDPDIITNSGSSGANGLTIATIKIVNNSIFGAAAGVGIVDTPLITGDPVNGGTWQIGHDGTLVLNADSVDATQVIDFIDPAAVGAGHTGALVVGQHPSGTTDAIGNPALFIAPGATNVVAGFQAAIHGYQAGNLVQFNGVTVASDSVSKNTVTLFDAGHNTLGSLSFFAGKFFSPDNAGAALAAVQIACYAAGTLIETAGGRRAVETLQPGDEVRTLLGGPCQIVWVGARTIDCARHPQPETVWPIRIERHAFAPETPSRDLFVSPDHGIYVDEVLIPARLLVNGTSVRQVEVQRVLYHHIEFARHDVVLAEGLAAETYLHTGDRAKFSGGTVIDLHPDFAARMWEMEGCAPLVLTGERLQAARARLAKRAGTRARPDKLRAPVHILPARIGL